ncbi:L-threonylcarbamoyladenylate synthase [Planktothrix mougeotii]|uniref:L-threonylcarbamoyladenylate synthase n=1 Tax=Planktothrix mougeotii LEGE 06226 TaxID=1828728 RepID=A0ABR9UDX4_9CYAN|nr:L-threonylcarbamoyladenylate synthase [Planktothrix mougeotii]MBE9144662.1 L-threonylcarbamoyladenylate synthase [Planktothrix mougeotii LEGE 06226]
MVQVSIDALIDVAISGDGVVSFPTDTVPALATRPDQAELIFQTKQRSQDKPLILMGATPEALWPYVKGTVEELLIWQQIAQQYWPGALTLVLPASEKVSPAMNPIDPSTIGIRVPNCAIAQHILSRTGPMATTSANLSGQPPLLTLAEINTQFPDVVTLFSSECDATLTASTIPSTVAKWQGNSWKILRQGAINL